MSRIAERPLARRTASRHRSRWLVARRALQLLVLAAFLAGPWAGLWVVRGTLASSEWFGVLPLTDPFVALQSLLAHRSLAPIALFGAGVVAAFYVVFGGRSFCAWVCPINPVTDLAASLRTKLRLPGLLGARRLDRRLRYGVLVVALASSALLGSVAWEAINPITLLHRALLFGLVGGYGVVLAVFLFDLLVVPRGWCGHLCPVGAFYGLAGRAAVLHVSAPRRDACTQCGDCFRACPEPHVIAPALYGAGHGRGPTIASADCTRCARCIDVCDEHVFDWQWRRSDREGRAMTLPRTNPK
ncbi:MAG: quinol dehydrogenase ferredoxin subunit NapH [Burkholderiaceae bacterium]|nr:quinol dehydrogenase ferredoxin subunit NapH [Burkholderiaceae bacterium]